MIQIKSTEHNFLRILNPQTYKQCQVSSVRNASEWITRGPELNSHWRYVWYFWHLEQDNTRSSHTRGFFCCWIKSLNAYVDNMTNFIFIAKTSIVVGFILESQGPISGIGLLGDLELTGSSLRADWRTNIIELFPNCCHQSKRCSPTHFVSTL